MTKPFRHSYPDYHKLIASSVFEGIRICEIGPSGQPSIKSSIIKAKGLDYTIIDIETTYWEEYNPEVEKFNIDLQRDFDSSLENKFDLVISQMVLEHIEDSKSFHEGIFNLLKRGGSAIHLYANPYSIPAIVNGILPESIGSFILSKIKNRDLDKNHKYHAFYRWCFFPSQKANRNFESLGYRIVDHMGYPGHNYFQRVPILNQLEQLYSWALCKFKFKKFSTLSLLHVKKQ